MTTVLQYLLTRKGLRAVMRWGSTLGVLIAVLAIAYWLYIRFSVPQVTVTKVVEGPVVQAFYATGTLMADREYAVKSNVEGTVTEILVDKGMVVKRGQKLAHIYVEEFQLKQKQAEADLELKQKLAKEETSPTLLEFDAKIRAAQQQLETAQREYDRLAKLRGTGGLTLTEFDRAESAVTTNFNNLAALQSAKATKRLEFERDLKVAQAALEITQWNVQQQTVVSPIDGVVLDWPVTRGARVKVNDMILSVADIAFDKLVMRVNVDEEDKTRVKLEQEVQVSLYSYPQRVFTGNVRKIYPKADPTRRTFEIDVSLAEPDTNFAAGMTGELAFTVDSKANAIVVPSQAVQQGKLWQIQQGKLQTVEVKVGLKSIQRTEILSGIQPNEEVIISPIGSLTIGHELRSQFMDPLTAAGLNEPKKDTSGFSKF
jgi:HlyD family secretion protein